MLFWNENKTTVEKSVFLERLSVVMKKDEWIIDGNYASTMELRLKEADTVFFLDYPLDVCLAGIEERKGTRRSDMPWIETEDDAEFIEFVKNFNSETRPQVIELLNKYSAKSIYVFADRTEADEFLKKQKNEKEQV
jgi:adenylate kinase family enzyme